MYTFLRQILESVSARFPATHLLMMHKILGRILFKIVIKIFLSPRNVTVQNVMPFYPDIIMAQKFWLSPQNVTLENVTTYFVRQMNRPLVARPVVQSQVHHGRTPIGVQGVEHVFGEILPLEKELWMDKGCKLKH